MKNKDRDKTDKDQYVMKNDKEQEYSNRRTRTRMWRTWRTWRAFRGEKGQEGGKDPSGKKAQPPQKTPSRPNKTTAQANQYLMQPAYKIETHHGRAVPRPARNPSIEAVLGDRGVGGDVFALGGPPAGVETIEIHLSAPGNIGEGGRQFLGGHLHEANKLFGRTRKASKREPRLFRAFEKTAQGFRQCR